MSEKNFASYGDMETLVTEIVDKCGPYTEISYDDWLQLTPYQQEHGRWDVTGVPGADGTISIDLMTKLWENPDPTAEFAAQDITLASDDYDLLLIIVKHSYGTNYNYSAIINKGTSGRLISSGGDPVVIRHRDFMYSTNTKYAVSMGYEGNSGTNALMIPLVIYGIKLHHTVEIKAIAPEVSTLASKCMMSDGETSVEDELDKVDKIRIVLSGEITASTAKEFFLTLMQRINALNLSIGENCFVKCTWSDKWYCCGYVCRTSTNYITFNITPYSGSYFYGGCYNISSNSVTVYQYKGTVL